MHNAFMKESFDKALLLSRQITENDWREYKDFVSRMYAEEDLSRFLGGNDPEIADHWRNSIRDSEYVLFGLYHENKMVGSSAIFFRPCEAVFAGIMIDPAYRRQGLADYLHDVRKRYLAGLDFQGDVITEILPDNTRSTAAAERNGFQLSLCREIDGIRYKIFKLCRG